MELGLSRCCSAASRLHYKPTLLLDQTCPAQERRIPAYWRVKTWFTRSIIRTRMRIDQETRSDAPLSISAVLGRLWLSHSAESVCCSGRSLSIGARFAPLLTSR